MKGVLSTVLCTGLFLAAPVYAGDDEEVPQRGNLEQLKQKCAELQANQQIKPFKVQITCRESGFTWKQGQGAPVSILGHREVGGSVRMKNMEIPYTGREVKVEPTIGSCPTFEKWKYLIAAVDVQLSCEELNKVTSVTEFCLPVIFERVQQDPTIVQQENTGEVLNVCKGPLF